MDVIYIGEMTDAPDFPQTRPTYCINCQRESESESELCAECAFFDSDNAPASSVPSPGVPE